jgi:Uma2 family endonuclease
MAISDPSTKIPPLRNGDRLSSAEFERRYEAMTDLKKAELVEGIVYVHHSTCDPHGQAHSALALWLGLYRLGTPHLISSVLGSIRLDLDNQFQPDVHLRIASGCGGRAAVGDGRIVEGPPELVGEVAFNYASYDLHSKLQVYRRKGVLEYVVWRLEDGAIDWFVSREGRFDRLRLHPDGLYRSEVFPGLWLNPGALLRGDLRAVSRAVRDGLASPEHEAFVAKMLKAGESR